MLNAGLFEGDDSGGTVTLVQLVGGIKLRLGGDNQALPLIVTSPLTPPDPMRLDLTRNGLAGTKFPLIVAGDDYALRFSVRKADDSAAVDLTNALVAMTIRVTDQGLVLVSRRTDVEIQSGLWQILLDDQTTDHGPTGTSGQGWGQVNFHNSEEEVMIEAAGVRPFDLRANLGSSVITLARGKVELLIPDTPNLE